jgi:hypothetical protein
MYAKGHVYLVFGSRHVLDNLTSIMHQGPIIPYSHLQPQASKPWRNCFRMVRWNGLPQLQHPTTFYLVWKTDDVWKGFKVRTQMEILER